MTTTTVKKKAPLKLGVNEYQYNSLADLEAKIITTYDKLKIIADEALGIDRVNMGSYLKCKNPAQYLCNEYANLWLADYPEHLNREHLFIQQTNVSIENVQQLHTLLNGYMDKMHRWSPTINSNGLKSNLKKSAFNIYLKEEHRAKYEALNDFLDCVEVLKQWYGNSNNINFVRAYSDLQMVGLDIKINTSRFS